MFFNCLLLTLLPAIAFSGLVVKIIPGETADESSVEMKGSDLSVINDGDRKMFKLKTETLKRASEKIMGKRCDEIYLMPPTPYGNVWEKYDWELTQRRVQPFTAKVLRVKTKTTAVNRAVLTNSHNKIDSTYSTSVTQQVEESVEHTWSTGGEFNIGQEIKYEVNFGVGSVGGATSLSYTSSWGKDTAQARTITLGTTSTVQVTIPPGGKVVAVLTATKGTLEAEVIYAASLTNGSVFCNYRDGYKGHHFYKMPMWSLQTIMNTPFGVQSSEKISVGFYTSAEIDVNNGTTHKRIDERSAGIIKVGRQRPIRPRKHV